MLRRAVVPAGVPLFRAAACLAIVLSAGSAGAQTGAWVTAGPLGGNVYSLVSDPSHPSTLYAGTSQGVFRSDDAGASWHGPGAGIPAARVQTIAIDPTVTSTLYAGTLTPSGFPSVGMFKSTDSGATWAPINEGLSDPLNGVAPLDVAALAIDPNHPGTIVAGTMYSEIFRSTDSGASWQPVTLGGSSFLLQTLCLRFDPSNPSTVYAASSEGLLKSGDNGLSWATYGTSVALYSLAIDPSTPQTLYAGNAAGVGMLKSTSGGAQWQLVNAGLPILHDSAGDYSPLVVALEVDPANPSTVYAGSYGSGLFESTNGAGSWSASSSGIRNTFVMSLALAGASGQGSTLYAGTLGGGVSESANAGQSWTARNAGLDSSSVDALVLDPGAADTLYAGTSDGVSKSGDAGRSWQAVNSGFPVSAVSALAFAPGSPGTLFAGTLGGGLWKSSDGGASWTASAQGLSPELYFSSLAVDPSSATTLYAGTAHPYDGSHSERVFKSTNGGGAWTQTSLDASGFTIDFIAVNPAKAAQVVAGSHGVIGYYQSLDSGQTWSTVASDQSCGGINRFLFDSAGATLYIAGTAGLCRSSDAGKTWQVSSVGSFSVETLVIDPTSPSTLYAGTSLNGAAGGGVFRSQDGGSTWQPFGSGLNPVAVTALAIDPSGKTLHASTHGAAVADLSVGTSRPSIHAPTPPRGTKTLTPR